MEAGSAVARISSRTVRPCAAGAVPQRYTHVREEALHFGLLDPQERPRVWRTGGRVAKNTAARGVDDQEAWIRVLGPPSVYIAPGVPLRWAPLGPHLGYLLWA
jgi:hypothetical protein